MIRIDSCVLDILVKNEKKIVRRPPHGTETLLGNKNRSSGLPVDWLLSGFLTSGTLRKFDMSPSNY